MSPCVLGGYSGWKRSNLDRQEKGLVYYPEGGGPASHFLSLGLSFPVCTIRELNNKKKYNS